MAQLHRSVVTLRIAGNDLLPDEISKRLGASPTEAETKGDRIVGKKTGHVRIAKCGMWRLCASDCEPEDIDGQIREILGKLTADIAVWQSITKSFHADLFCGLFMRVGNEGLTISAASLEALGVRGVELSLDIYGGDDDDNGTNTQSGKREWLAPAPHTTGHAGPHPAVPKVTPSPRSAGSERRPRGS